MTLILLLGPANGVAQTYALQLVDNDPFANYASLPNGCSQIAHGINDFGDLAGEDCGGFVRIGTSFTQLSYPGATLTRPLAINNADTVVGYAVFPDASVVNFSWSGGNFRTISVPGVPGAFVTAISNNGMIAGYFGSGGFVLDAGEVNVTTFSCGQLTSVAAINNAGQVVGTVVPGPASGFLWSGGACTTFSVPGALDAHTQAFGINDSGQIYGEWLESNGNGHGFRRDPNGQFTVLDFTDDSDSSFSGKINNNGQVTGSYQNTATSSDYAFILSPSALVDPVPDLLSGASVTTNGDLLASLGRGVVGVSADGVTQVVVRIFATAPGQQFTVKVFNDHVNSTLSASANEDGALGLPGTFVLSQNQITITSQNTNAGPQAFAIYQAPLDFMRASGTFPTKSVSCPSLIGPLPDDALWCRQVTIQVQGPTGSLTIPVQIVRPPVIAIHGLWSNSSMTFANFFTTDAQGTPDRRFSVQRVNYDTPVGDFVTSTQPDYDDPDILANIKANSLGFQYNVASVKRQMNKRLSLFTSGLNPIAAPVAAVQVDVVAHSMGGDITRTLALATNEYFRAENYAAGDIHKAITIATPHLGTPVAIQFLEDENSCVRNFLAGNVLGMIPLYDVSIRNAVLDGDPSLPGKSLVFGAIGDLSGDGLGGPTMSSALNNIAISGPRPIPTALIGGTINATNLAGLASAPSAAMIRLRCTTNIGTTSNPIFVGDPLALNLSSTAWPNVFGQADSDGVVPLTSQLNRVNGFLTTFVPAASLFNGVHSPGIAQLGFSPPTLLDCCNVPLRVIDLLNTPVTDPVFNPINP